METSSALDPHALNPPMGHLWNYNLASAERLPCTACRYKTTGLFLQIAEYMCGFAWQREAGLKKGKHTGADSP